MEGLIAFVFVFKFTIGITLELLHNIFYQKVCVLTLPRRIPSLLHFSHVLGYAGHSVSWCCCRKKFKFQQTIVSMTGKAIFKPK